MKKLIQTVKSSSLIISSFCFALLVIGCGNKPVNAPEEHVNPSVSLQNFEKQNWRFANNKFFLWKNNMTANQAQRAMDISSDIDVLDGTALPLNRQALQLENEIDPMKESLKQSNADLRKVKAELDKTTKKQKALNDNISKTDKELQAEQGKAVPDLDKIKQLSKDLEALKQQSPALQNDLNQIKLKKDSLDKVVATKKTELEPKLQAQTELDVQRAAVEEKGRSLVNEIMTIVDWYKDQPTSVAFQFEAGGTIGVSITGWNLGDDAGARNFSTNLGLGGKPSVRNVSYTEKGGKFKFEVDVYNDDAQTQLRETFSFSISRIKYGKYDPKDGRVFYGGDLTSTRYTAKGNVVRKGIAKLVDRNN